MRYPPLVLLYAKVVLMTLLMQTLVIGIGGAAVIMGGLWLAQRKKVNLFGWWPKSLFGGTRRTRPPVAGEVTPDVPDLSLIHI